MYSDKRKEISLVPLFLAAIAIILILVWLVFGRSSGKDLSEESASAIREAVVRSAHQCYIVEGAYPPDLAYLEDNYGLQVNTRDFYVNYEAFASNLPPQVKVVSKVQEPDPENNK